MWFLNSVISLLELLDKIIESMLTTFESEEFIAVIMKLIDLCVRTTKMSVCLTKCTSDVIVFAHVVRTRCNLWHINL